MTVLGYRGVQDQQCSCVSALRGRGKSCSRRRVTLDHDATYRQAVHLLGDKISVPLLGSLTVQAIMTLWTSITSLRSDHHSDLTDYDTADEHSRRTLWIRGYTDRVGSRSTTVATSKRIVRRCLRMVATSQASLIPLYTPTVRPPPPTRLPPASAVSSLQVPCGVPKHPLTIVPRFCTIGFTRPISGQRVASGIHSALQRQDLFCLPQQPVYHPVDFAAIGR
jgi:hypothetical protein